jgi:hypothetical protein
MNEKLLKKVSPPFEGGVVGTIDYHIYTIFYFPTGVVDSLISFLLFCMKVKILFNRKILKSLKNKSIEIRRINHPGRYQHLHHNYK